MRKLLTFNFPKSDKDIKKYIKDVLKTNILKKEDLVEYKKKYYFLTGTKYGQL